jgi:hypothetical protein
MTLEPIKIGDCDYCMAEDMFVIDMSLHHKRQDFWCLRCLREKLEELENAYIRKFNEEKI